ncbi:MAG TPA: MmgE/PrpD family protein [Myxococcota bacterium]|nr:MmgE/PrpD family protein [Myxococcota bacterium]
MTTSLLATWAEWSTSLQLGDVPERVLERARLQHLSTAGAVHTSLAAGQALGLGLGRGKEPALASGRRVGQKQALRYHAGNAAAWDCCDQILWGPAGPGSVCGTWSSAREHTLGELLLATVIANELSARVGAAGLLAPNSATGWTGLQAVAAAAAIARLRGSSAETTANALALSLSDGGCASTAGLATSHHVRARVAANAVVAGASAVDAASDGIAGPVSLLDTDAWYQALGCPVVLRHVFGGLGTAWLTDTLWFKLTAGSPWHNVAMQALEEIHSRHIRAADKRLRPDQWTEAVIRVSLPVWAADQVASVDREGLTWSLRAAYATSSRAHQLGPREFGESFWAEEGGDIAELAGRIRVEHAWEHTVAAIRGLAEQGILGGLTLGQLKHAAGAFRTALPGPETPAGADLLELAKLGPLAGGLSAGAFDPRAFRYVLPMDVKVHTTRGGFWPETRSLPEGSPGWNWEDTLARVQAKFAGGDPARTELAQELLTRSTESSAEDFVSAL